MSARKTVLGWDLDTIAHLFHLPPRQQEKVAAALADIPGKAYTTSLRKWRNLLGMLRSITPAVTGSRSMFTKVQHSLKRATGKHIQITVDMHNELEAWRKLVRSLVSRPTHLRELEHFFPTWIGTTDASVLGMGGAFLDPEGQYFVLHSPFYLTTQACLVSSSKPTGDVTINDLELEALLMQILIFAPRMDPLDHIHMYVGNTAAHGWSNRGSVRTSSAVVPILQGIYLATR